MGDVLPAQHRRMDPPANGQDGSFEVGVVCSSEPYGGLDGRWLDPINDQCVRLQPGTVGGIQVSKVLASVRSGADERTAGSGGGSLLAGPDLWSMRRCRINDVFPLPGPRQLVHAAHDCSRGLATPKLLLLYEQRS